MTAYCDWLMGEYVGTDRKADIIVQKEKLPRVK